MMKNNHDRPEFGHFETSALSTQKCVIEELAINFNNGYVNDLVAKDNKDLTFFRALHHMERYQFAAEKLIFDNMISYKRVLDIGIADGAGVNAFESKVKSNIPFSLDITGLEIEKDTLIICQRQHPSYHLFQESAESFQAQQPYDVIFCFELIGNASLSSDDVLLAKVRQMLGSGGTAFLSIACFDESDESRSKKKNYSSRIYSRRSFSALIERNFTGFNIAYYGQYYPLKRFKKEDVGVWSNPNNENETHFMIAVVSA